MMVIYICNALKFNQKCLILAVGKELKIKPKN